MLINSTSITVTFMSTTYDPETPKAHINPFIEATKAYIKQILPDCREKN